jgi:cell division septal protein FtsQ
MKKKRNRYRRPLKMEIGRFFRALRPLGGLFLAVVLVVLVSAALAHSYQALLELPGLRLEGIEVKGLERLEQRALLELLDLPAHCSVLKVRKGLLASRLEAHPWVQSAVVRLDPPRRLVLEIVEREPLAVVYTDSFFLVDTQGKLFLEVAPNAYHHLPLITGLAGEDLHVGDPLPEDLFECLQGLLASMAKAQAWLPVAQISEFHWGRGAGFTLYTVAGAIPVHLGLDDLDDKLGRLQAIVKLMSQRRWWEAVQAIDLDYPRQAYVRGSFVVPSGI